jgi:hypothetical protein
LIKHFSFALAKLSAFGGKTFDLAGIIADLTPFGNPLFCTKDCPILRFSSSDLPLRFFFEMIQTL